MNENLGKLRRSAPAVLLSLLLAASWIGCSDQVSSAVSGENATAEEIPLDVFFSLIHTEAPARRLARKQVSDHWRLAYASLVLEIARFSHEGGELVELVEDKTGQAFGGDMQKAMRWLWAQKVTPHSEYRRFKSHLYSHIDRRFAAYFADDAPDPKIRLDEIQWGGVRRDGIPPLKDPRHIAAEEAGYLSDTDVVFGLAVEGDVRAYPKRILAWHEMAKDVVGGVSINAVYCTLCGTVVVYRTEKDGVHYELGTSGFLYRSNKLMYDHASESLWSTFGGEPVVGPLVGRGIALEPLSVVTTTWGEWRARHPDTRVLSPETGHSRDYREGAAYRDYFATDDLMFAVPFEDDRLPNKAEVLALRFGASDAEPVAIDTALLSRRPLYRGRHGGIPFVILTDTSGANRVYEEIDEEFVRYQGQGSVVDRNGTEWQLREDALVGPSGQLRKRLAAHRAFWFGWHAAHPETELIQGG